MKGAVCCLMMILLTSGVLSAQGSASSESVRVDARPEKGFSYRYYLYVPKVFRDGEAKKKRRTILVIPNNSEKNSDDLSVHEADVQRRIKNNSEIADKLGVALLMPVFPRPQSDCQIYTHALDRESMTTGKKEFARFDRQLVAMI